MRARAVKADKRLHQKVAERRHPLITKFFRVVTSFGSIVFGSILAGALHKTDEEDTSRQILAGLAISKVLVYFLKTKFGRDRPEDILIDTRTPSFPSGHTTTAFAIATILGNRTGQKSFFQTIAGLTGLSRVYLGAHYPSDIVVGSGLGRLIGNLMSQGSKQS